MDENEEITFIALVMKMFYCGFKLLKQKNRRWWERPLYQKKKPKGFFENTFQFIKNYDGELFFKATRLTRMQYDLLLSLVKDRLKKKSIRTPISPECRMVVTLMYLSQGVSPNYLARTFRMGTSTIRMIILEVCQVFWDVLSPVYMPECKTGDWKEMSKEFNERWDMPHCVGSIAGKHVAIKRPPNSGSKYINYKGFYSIVLLAVCDANYTFTVVDVGAYGSQIDGGNFQNSTFGKQMFLNKVQLPPPEKLPNFNKVVPYYFVADSTFPLRENLMRPYTGTVLDIPQQVFNFKISVGYQIIENTFGIMVSRWKILNKPIEFHPKNAEKIVLACTILHNFVKITDKLYKLQSYCPEGFCDSYDSSNGERIDGMWRKETNGLLSVRKFGRKIRSVEAFEVRKLLTNYFLRECQVSFEP